MLVHILGTFGLIVDEKNVIVTTTKACQTFRLIDKTQEGNNKCNEKKMKWEMESELLAAKS